MVRSHDRSQNTISHQGKNRAYIAKVNISNISHLIQHIDIEIPHGSRDHVIVPDTVKITFNLDINSTDIALNVVNNVSRVLVKKKDAHAWLKNYW